MNDGEFQSIVLIERKNQPLGLALPGGTDFKRLY